MLDKTGIGGIPPSELVEERRINLPLWITVWGQIVKQKPLATVGLVIVAILFFVGIFANFLAPEGLNEPHPERIELGEGIAGTTQSVLVGPSLAPFHPMGLDNLGRDVFSRVIYGARISMMVGVFTVVIATLVACIIGMGSAWLGGKVDILAQRLVDGMMIFPWLVVVIVVASILGDNSPIDALGKTNWEVSKVVFALAITNVAWLSRVIRSASLTVRENQYVDAARALGASGWRINLRYILPNIMAPIITLATLGMGYAILAEAAVSFLGYGITPPTPSWGAMLSMQGQNYLHRAPWLAIFPGVMIILVVFGINVLGDGMRDLLDPRLKGKSGRFST
jgi:peptide/nickel transport system permease protein